MRLAHILDRFVHHHTASPEIHTLSLHDALPISGAGRRRPRGRTGADRRASPRPRRNGPAPRAPLEPREELGVPVRDRKSTRLNSSHRTISYAVFCLKKKKEKEK